MSKTSHHVIVPLETAVKLLNAPELRFELDTGRERSLRPVILGQWQKPMALVCVPHDDALDIWPLIEGIAGAALRPDRGGQSGPPTESAGHPGSTPDDAPHGADASPMSGSHPAMQADHHSEGAGSFESGEAGRSCGEPNSAEAVEQSGSSSSEAPAPTPTVEAHGDPAMAS